ncbi:Peroxiredoxin [bacterium A37T11]|nr:Peroxiredoxin [bacterium A37T11]
MKNYLLSLLACLPLLSVGQQQNYRIEGSIKDLQIPLAKAYIQYNIDDTHDHRDSGMIVHGKFTITGSVPYPTKAVLYISPRDSVQYFPARLDQREIYLENGTIVVGKKDSVYNAVIEGSVLNDQFQELTQLLHPFVREEEKLHRYDVNSEGKPAEMAKGKEWRKELKARKKAAALSFINKYPDSWVSLDVLSDEIDPAYDLKNSKKLFHKFPSNLRTSPKGLAYQKLFAVAVGVQAPNFTSKSIDGTPVSLASYRGRYVLVDFWASWCMPCRAQNPSLIKTYNTYKDRKFSVLGVSVDYGKKGKEMWLRAIQMDKLPWDQVSDLTGFDCAPAQLYSIHAVPTNFLIDPKGKIIAKNLHGEELAAKLASLLSIVR